MSQGATALHYGLTEYGVGSSQFLPLSEADYRAALQAQHVLRVLVAFEEKLEIVLASLVEYEEAVFSVAVRHAVRALVDDRIQRRINWLDINRRVSDLLSCSRQYLELTKRDFSRLLPGDTARQERLKKNYSVAFDRLFGYRVGEALRNIAMHDSLPRSWPSSFLVLGGRGEREEAPA